MEGGSTGRKLERSKVYIVGMGDQYIRSSTYSDRGREAINYQLYSSLSSNCKSFPEIDVS